MDVAKSKFLVNRILVNVFQKLINPFLGYWGFSKKTAPMIFVI